MTDRTQGRRLLAGLVGCLGSRGSAIWLLSLGMALFSATTARAAAATATGEVVVVPPWWAKNAALSVDGRPLGNLPQKLLLSPGPHKLVLQQGRVLLPVDVAVSAGRATIVRWPRLKTPEVTQSKAVGLVLEPADVAAPLRQAVVGAVHAEHYAVLGEVGTLDSGPQPAACGESAACMEEIAQAAGLRFVLSLQVKTGEGGGAATGPVHATLRLFDVDTGDIGLSQQVVMTAADGAAKLAAATVDLLRRGPVRPLGLLEISSQPSGAEVLIDGRRLGTTPYRRAASPGEHDVVVHKSGFSDYLNTVDVQAGCGSALDAVLRPDRPAEPPASAAPRVPATAKR